MFVQAGLASGVGSVSVAVFSFMNDLILRMPAGVSVSAFADDLAVWCTSKSMRECSERLQSACDVVVAWCD